uniref:Ribosomal protein L9 n=1 Tax=Harveyella mirabilis TaxID=282355 RepID=A0A3S8UW35_9FLOR|nr:ribosomal protein L9 [Harveyella mirabilis]
MIKKIQIVLTKDNAKNQKINDIIYVSNGYATNYLIPNQIAEFTTIKKIKHIKMFKEINQNKYIINKININLINEKSKKIQKIYIYKKNIKNITETNISKWFLKHTNLNINKKQIKILKIRKNNLKYIIVQIKQKEILKKLIQIIPINI